VQGEGKIEDGESLFGDCRQKRERPCGLEEERVVEEREEWSYALSFGGGNVNGMLVEGRKA